MTKDGSNQPDSQDPVSSDDVVEQPTETVAADAPVGIPKHIGHFHVKRVIASGGMGTVYEAVQEQPRRTVALKVMKHGIASRSALRRFEYESQILARLHHPGVAQVYEAGTHDDGSGPVPYFAMEYVPNARPITQYATDKKLGTRERLELFGKVCEAVHHGHQKGVIHRDLKPSNILVDSHGNVKVIDFGVARGTDSDMAVTTLQTDVGQLIGTLQYMSPEQCEADPHDLDTRSDVYALGVVLYELLCENPPYDVSRVAMYEAARVIREQPPTRLSTINRTLRGDVETIAHKALEKDRERRYQSADELRRDVRHYLSGEPISARPPSVAYQLRIFARRNKVLFGATAAVFVVLVAGVIVSTSLYFRAEREATRAEGEARKARQAEAEQRRLAEKEAEALQEAVAARAAAEAQREEAREQADKATAVFGFLEDVLAEADPYVQAKPGITLREVIEQAGPGLASRFTEQPLVEAKVRVLLGRVLANQGQFQAAEEHFESAVRTLEQAEADPSELIVARAYWVGTQLALGNFERIKRRSQQMTMETEGISLETGVKLLSQFDFSIIVKTGEHPWLTPDAPAEDSAMTGQALRLLEAITGGRSPAVALTWRFLAISKKSQGKWDEAEDYTQRALDIYHRMYGDEHVLVADGLYALAGVLGRKEEWEEAEDNYRRCLQMRRKLLGEAHPDVACALMGVGWVRKEQARFTEAERSLRDALAILRQLHGSKEWFATLMAEIWLGEVLQKQGRHDEADQLAREAREVRGCLPGSQHDGCLDYFTRMGFALIFQDRGADAEAYCREALALTRKLRGDEHPDVAMSLLMLGAMLYEEGEYSAVQPLLRESLRLDPGDDWIRSGLAELLYKTGDMEGTAECHREIFSRALAGEDATALNVASWQVVKYPHWNAELYALALRAAQAADSAEPDNRLILNTLGVAQYRVGKFEEALATLRKSDRLNAEVYGSRIPADVTFIAMSHHQLGQTGEALADLNALREIMKQDSFNDDEESQSFLREAGALIDPSPPATQPATTQPSTTQPATKPPGLDP